ncbi:beta glucosidase 40 [Actinidia rufa]|uniref:Beta glucosidase 40 n=1 Tax=Actinidia rufa TaxID=165716 RepID=A0A7J0EQW0_9ERIC|nr:beta glucosidase 40 [Actinidia rufa]
MEDALSSLIHFLRIPSYWERLLEVELVSDLRKELKNWFLEDHMDSLPYPSFAVLLALNELSRRDDIPIARSVCLTSSSNLAYISTRDMRIEENRMQTRWWLTSGSWWLDVVWLSLQDSSSEKDRSKLFWGWLSDNQLGVCGDMSTTVSACAGSRGSLLCTLLSDPEDLHRKLCQDKLNERQPHTFTIQGYDVGLQAPGRCSILLHIFCRGGNSATEPYIVAHNVLLSHATVADIYRRKYKPKQHGLVGVSFDVIWFEPATNSTADIEAAQRAQDFQLGWFIEPLVFGEYPSLMITRVGSRLPRFTEAESALLKGSLDFVGINHYTTFYAKPNTTNIIGVLLKDSITDSGVITLPFRDGKPIGDRANSIWLYVVPHGLRSLMNYIKQKYGNPPVIITENGMDDANSPFISLKDALKDEKRIKYHNDYLESLLASIKYDGCNVKGYFVWSLLDNWEWAAGFSSRFGLYFVDYGDKLKRYPKDSVKWFKTFLTSA